MIAALGVVLLFSSSPTTPTWHPSAPAPSYGLRLNGSTLHRHPIAGKPEPVDWTVTNIGNRSLNDVTLDTTVPPGWTLSSAHGCQSSGIRLRCELGTLKANRPATVHIEMVARRPLSSYRLGATTSFRAAGQKFAGPAAGFEVTVVAHR